MSIAIGIRVEPKCIHYAIYDSDNQEIINVEDIKFPESLDFPQALKFIRHTIIDIINEYKVTTAGIRLSEGSARNLSIDRISIEAIIQESFSSSTVSAYKTFRLASLAARFNINQTILKEYIATGYKAGFIDLTDYNKNQREAILSAVGVTL